MNANKREYQIQISLAFICGSSSPPLTYRSPGKNLTQRREGATSMNYESLREKFHPAIFLLLKFLKLPCSSPKLTLLFWNNQPVGGKKGSVQPGRRARSASRWTYSDVNSKSTVLLPLSMVVDSSVFLRLRYLGGIVSSLPLPPNSLVGGSSSLWM